MFKFTSLFLKVGATQYNTLGISFSFCQRLYTFVHLLYTESARHVAQKFLLFLISKCLHWIFMALKRMAKVTNLHHFTLHNALKLNNFVLLFKRCSQESVSVHKGVFIMTDFVRGSVISCAVWLSAPSMPDVTYVQYYIWPAKSFNFH